MKNTLKNSYVYGIMATLVKFFLILTLLISSSFAQNEKETDKSSKKKEKKSLLDKAVDTVKGKAQNAAQDAIAKAFASSSNVNPYSVNVAPDDYFPQCSHLASRANRNALACPISRASCSPSEQQGADAYYILILKMMNHYENFQTGSNKPSEDYTGLTCVERSIDDMNNNVLVQRVNAIEDLKETLAEQDRKNRQTLENEKKKLVALNNELFKGENVDYSQYTNTPTCNTLNNEDVWKEMGQGGGLKNLLSENKKTYRAAQDFSKNAPRIKQDIENSIARTIQSIRSRGLYKFSAQGFNAANLNINSEIKSTNSMQNALDDIKSFYQDKFSEYDTVLRKSLDYAGSDKDIYNTLVADGDGVDINEKVEQWVNEKQTQCFYQAISGGQKDFEKNLNRMNPKGTTSKTGSQNQAGKRLKGEIQRILKIKSLSFPNKISRIKELIKSEAAFKSLELVMENAYLGKSGRYGWNPAELIEGIYGECQKNMDQSYAGTEKSLNDAIKTVRQMRDNIAGLKENFLADTKLRLENRLLTCKDASGSPIAVTTCSAQSMQVKDDFCFNTAGICTQNTRSCLGTINKIYRTKKQQVTQSANLYNIAGKGFSEALYKTFQNAKDIYKKESALYSNKPYNIAAGAIKDIDHKIFEPEKASKVDPELKELDALGIKLANPEEYIKVVKKNLDQIIKATEKQNDTIKKKLDKHLKKLTKQYSDELKRWEKEKDQCDRYFSQCQTLQNEMTKKVGEQKNVCEDYQKEYKKVDSDNTQLYNLIETMKDAEFITSDEDTKEKIDDFLEENKEFYDFTELNKSDFKDDSKICDTVTKILDEKVEVPVYEAKDDETIQKSCVEINNACNSSEKDAIHYCQAGLKSLQDKISETLKARSQEVAKDTDLEGLIETCVETSNNNPRFDDKSQVPFSSNPSLIESIYNKAQEN
ncbi:MAG: hypothetical protein H6620_05695 [Halobacteriovoraceae bacterium]|nr:hypothetical protein [Halobacteriovoraceae bacterium]